MSTLETLNAEVARDAAVRARQEQMAARQAAKGLADEQAAADARVAQAARDAAEGTFTATLQAACAARGARFAGAGKRLRLYSLASPDVSVLLPDLLVLAVELEVAVPEGIELSSASKGAQP